MARQMLISRSKSMRSGLFGPELRDQKPEMPKSGSVSTSLSPEPTKRRRNTTPGGLTPFSAIEVTKRERSISWFRPEKTPMRRNRGR